jgi:hypothetical protein
LNERGFETLHELFYGVAFQEDCLLQCAKELLVRRGAFDGTEVKLGAGSYHGGEGVSRCVPACPAMADAKKHAVLSFNVWISYPAQSSK